MRARAVGGVVGGLMLVVAEMAGASVSFAATTSLKGVTITFTSTRVGRAGALDVYGRLIRRRLDGLGLGGSVSRPGVELIVRLPGVNPAVVTKPLLGALAAPPQLEFRPVLLTVPPRVPAAPIGSPGGPVVGTAIAGCDPSVIAAVVRLGADPSTPGPGANDASDCVLLRVRNTSTRLLCGPVTGKPSLGLPAGLSDADISRAATTFSVGQGYAVDLTLTSLGQAKFNQLAASLFAQAAPRNEVAIVFDALVYTAPAFQTSSFTGPVQFTGGFSGADASDLAAFINLGSAPTLKVKRISATNR